MATIAVLLVLLAQVFLSPPAPWTGKPGAWHPPRSRAELLVAKMDGHSFAAIAADPTLSRTEDWYPGDPANAAYRSSRPIFGWLLFAASAGGQRDLIAPAALVLTAASIGLLLLATDSLARSLGARRVPALGAALVLPVSVAAIAYPGIADPLACALALFGLAAWTRGETRRAIVLLTVAVLTRETMVLVPLGIALDHLYRHRRVSGIWALLVPPSAYLGWTAIVRLRIGAWPSDYQQSDGFLTGFLEGFPNWRLAEWLTAAMLIASATVIVRFGTGWMRATLLAFVGFAALMNHQVWWVWLGFGRVASILPLFALVALAVREPAAAAEADVPDHASSSRGVL